LKNHFGFTVSAKQNANQSRVISYLALGLMKRLTKNIRTSDLVASDNEL
jgi:hypothetical protein